MPDPRAHARPAGRAARGGELSAPAAPLAWLEDGRLGFDEVPLEEVAAGVDGHAVLVVSTATVQARLDALVTVGHALDVGAVGPPDVLRWAAERGVALRVRSRHELALALGAGADPARLEVTGAVLDDGLLVDALSARVARVLAEDDATRANVARIAAHLGLPVPPLEDGTPRALAPLTGCGVLLAPVLRVGGGASAARGGAAAATTSGQAGAPSGERAPTTLALAVDALLPPRVGVLHALVRADDEPTEHAALVHGLSGLTERDGLAAACVGEPVRGDWVALTSPDAVAPWPTDPAHPVPETVLAQRGAWRFAEARPLPPRPEG